MAGRRYRRGNAGTAWLAAVVLALIIWLAFATAEYL
jgi:hypothetical protein